MLAVPGGCGSPSGTEPAPSETPPPVGGASSPTPRAPLAAAPEAPASTYRTPSADVVEILDALPTP